MADFTYNGERYTVDPRTQSISKVPSDGSAPLELGIRPADAKLQAAAAQALAQATSSIPTMAGLQARAGLDPTPPRADATADANAKPQIDLTTVTNGVSADPGLAKPTPGSDTLTNPLGTGNAPQPTAGPTAATLPATAPRANPYQAQIDANRTEYNDIQKKVAEINALPPDELVAYASLLNSYTSRLNQLDTANAKMTEPVKSSVISGTVTPDQEWIVQDDGRGAPDSITVTKNKAWDGTKSTKFTTASAGGKMFVIDQATGELKTTYGDADAQALANRNTAVSEANARVAQQNANLDDFATKARVEIEQAVGQGKDAASVRAQKQLELNEIFQKWQQADGDVKRAQTALDSYNVDRHAEAKDRLGTQSYEETVRNNKATEEHARQTALLTAQTSREATAAGMRNADVSQAGTKYAADVGATTARLQAANSLLQNGMSMLADINKTLPPGSDLAGRALEGLMQYGQKFMTGMAGPAPTMPGAASYADMVKGMPGLDTTVNAASGLTPGGTGIPAAGAPALQPVADQPANAIPQQANQYGGVSGADYSGPGAHVPETAEASAARNAAAMAGQGAGATNSILPETQQYMPDLSFNQQSINGGFTDPSAALANLYGAGAGTLAQQNAASHRANMAADGTNLAGPNDVKAIFGRNA